MLLFLLLLLVACCLSYLFSGSCSRNIMELLYLIISDSFFSFFSFFFSPSSTLALCRKHLALVAFDSDVPVSEPSSSSLPSDWEELYDESRQMPYYFNSVTEATSWDRPTE